MRGENSKKGVITLSVAAVLIFTGVILFLSLSDYFEKKPEPDNVSAIPVIESDAVPGENNKEVKMKITPEKIAGIYAEEHDGWFYNFNFAPTGEYHGAYTAAYDSNHSAVESNPEKDYSENGVWKLDNGEIKLYINDEYAKSLWYCGDYVIDSRNYFVGSVPGKEEDFQAAFVCKALESGDSQILNFYYDGKMIMEIIHDDGTKDKEADSSVQPAEESYKVFVGNYWVENNKITVEFIDKSQKVFYIVDDGIAGWVYNKKTDIESSGSNID